jgi:hypothetical protein
MRNLYAYLNFKKIRFLRRNLIFLTITWNFRFLFSLRLYANGFHGTRIILLWKRLLVRFLLEYPQIRRLRRSVRALALR